jgi:hypothetical protein
MDGKAKLCVRSNVIPSFLLLDEQAAVLAAVRSLFRTNKANATADQFNVFTDSNQTGDNDEIGTTGKWKATKYKKKKTKRPKLTV